MKDILKKIFVSSLLLFATVANAQETVEDAGWTAGSVDQATGNTIYEYPNMNDDGYAAVPLQFAFPFFGQTFTMSFMWDNGLVSFYDPTANVGCNPSNNYCGGYNWDGKSGFNNTGFSYFIAPMWADMKPSPDGETRYLTHGDDTYQSYTWENITEFYSDGSRDSTFGLEIRADGSFDSLYESLNLISSNAVTGYVGDHSNQSEIFLVDSWKSGEMVSADNWSAMTSYDPCTDNPLSSTECAGYEQAYYDQQCSQDALYDSGCAGYAEAYYDQQCSADALYDSGCPGYAEAYYDQQCNADALYDSGCPGYAEAYYDQQCSADALYDSGCPGYAEAYLAQQCSLDSLYDSSCPDYAEAYLAQQCELDQLSSPSCPNYATESALLALEETILNNTQDVSNDAGSVSFEEKFTPVEEDMSTFQENMYMSGEYVDETYTTEEVMDPIEEEIAILEELEVIAVMEEAILAEEEVAMLEELEESPINEEISEPTATRSNNSLAISLSVAMANDLVSNLEETAQNEAQNSSDGDQTMLGTQENGENSASVTGNGENSNVMTGAIEENSANAMTGDIFSSDTELFFSLTGDSQSESAESVSNNEQNEQNVQNEQQNLALGDAAPIGFAIIPMEMPSVQEEVEEEKSLAERMSEAIAEKNKEESNKAAAGQTAMITALASGTNIGQYYDTAYTNTKQFYNEEKIYEGVILRDNFRTHYNMFSGSHGKMYQLIRSQYDD